MFCISINNIKYKIYAEDTNFTLDGSEKLFSELFKNIENLAYEQG